MYRGQDGRNVFSATSVLSDTDIKALLNVTGVIIITNVLLILYISKKAENNWAFALRSVFH